MHYTYIKTVADALKATGRPLQMPDVSMLLQEDREHFLNNYRLKVVVEAINMEDGQKWRPEYNDGPYKYEPYWGIDASEEKPAGFGFSHSYCGDWGSYSGVGSRLCFRDHQRMQYCQEQFKELYLEEILSIARQKIEQ